MLTTLCALVYVIVFIPVWAFRRLTGLSRFGSRFHQGPSAWDRPAVSALPVAAGD